MARNERVRRVVKSIPGSEALYRRVRWAGADGVDVDSLSQQLQAVIASQHRERISRGEVSCARISDAGFRCYSQFEEDGIILYVLSAVGMETRTVVEIGCGNGTENMSSNLVINHGFSGYLFDGSPENVAHAERFFAAKKDCLLSDIRVTNAWVTAENVDALLADAGATGEVDLLSIDIDGNDYHVWKAIGILRPRLCVFETQDIVPGDLSLTVPYQADFDRSRALEGEHDFFSASLLAMSKLSAEKGYRLIGGHRHGFNAFFLRNDLGVDLFPAVSIESVHDNPWTRRGQAERWPKVRHMNWLEV